MSREFKEFPLGGINGLFSIKTPKRKFNANTITFDGNYPYIIRSGVNNGIKGYITQDIKYLNEGNTISFGQDTATMFYQKKPYFTGDKIKIFTLKEEELNEKLGLYFITVMKKSFSNFSWGSSSFNENVLNQIMISLPITSSGSIDYKYMEERISELEEERISELEAYLQVTGFSDYTLTAEEQEAIDKFNSGGVMFEKLKIGDLFDIRPTKNYGLTNAKLFQTSGSVPIVVNSSLNNGVGGYVGLQPLEKGNIITYSDTTTSDGIFYQPNDFIGYSHIQGLYPKNNIGWDKYSLLYFKTAFASSVKGKYNYGSKFNRTKALQELVYLPIFSTGEIDFSYMATFIKATQKLIVKGVVDWKDKIIRVTKKLL